LSQLAESHNTLSQLYNVQPLSGWKGPEEDEKRLRENFGKLWHFTEKSYKEGKIDNRIKVAVIDNGTDRIKAISKMQIATGISYVTATSESQDRLLPWWTVADSHGTEMASLITKVNQYCRLYIARVGKGRRDIKPTNAVKVRRTTTIMSVLF
jgi:hypothetical protein